MMALEWSDVDLHKRQLTVQHSEWKGHVSSTKGRSLRHVPITERLAALEARRHLRGSRVLVQSSGEPLTMKIVQDRVASAARRAACGQGCTSFDTRSARIWQCEAHPPERFRNSPDIASS
jgi:integrase